MAINVQEKVLIIGAGLGGLTLAQIFRRHNIPYEIFERTEALAQTRQGWSVGLVEYVIYSVQNTQTLQCVPESKH